MVAFGMVRNASHIAWKSLSSAGVGGVGGQLLDERDVEVGDEELGVRRAQHHHPHVGVGGELLGQLRHRQVQPTGRTG